MNKIKIVYLLPNLITITYVFAGFLSIHASIQGNYSQAALYIIMAAALDAVDGIIARATNTQSEFGEGLDCLADSFAFGASTSLLIYFWGLKQAVASHAIFISFIFLAAAMLRLANYMILSRITADRKYYLGLTVPSSSMLLAGIVICHPKPVEDGSHIFFLAILVLVLSLLMVSNLKYKNLFHTNFRSITNIFAALAATIIIIACILYPLCFLMLVLLYILSGPAMFIFGFFRQSLLEEQR